ncbi:MAG: hypothetical protein JRL30_02365 [Deltaproteobacteria bacterium]|nr:hypothetical protein [Deltaproteobacteria bacterium]
MKIRSKGFMVLWCLCLLMGGLRGNRLHAQEMLSDGEGTSRLFISDPVTPGISQEVRRLAVKPLRRPADPVRMFPRRPGNYSSAISHTGPRTTDPQMGEPGGSAPIRSPDPTLSFEGMSLQNGGDGVPPDTIGDVGLHHYVQMVNTAFAIFDKNGNRLSGPTDINQLWQGQGNACERCNDGDPVVLYDPLADRWVLSQFAVCEGPPYYECIAVSQTADPTGAYYLYAFEINDYFPDYPKLGVWPDAYYMSANESDVGAYAFDRDKMLQGESATYQKFERTGNFMLPSDLDGPTAPPSGSPNYFYTMKTGNVLEIWEFHVDFSTPANSTFTRAQTLTTSPFNYGLCGFDWDCIPQPGTSQRLDAISEWPMWRLQYRNFGTYETLVGNFTVDVGDFSDHAGIRWFELRKTPAGAWSIYQEGTHSPDAHHRWMGSVAMDGQGNIALGYSVSSATLYPSIRYATRSASDAAGTLQGEVALITGTASQTSFNRWGDYSSMNVDPSDDTTFWYTNEYLTDATQGWRTRIGTFSVQSLIFVEPSGSCGGNTPCYTTIQAAVDAASAESVIRIAAGTYAEDLDLNSSNAYTLQGGWNALFTSRTSTTSVSSITCGAGSGAVTIDDMEIQ